MKILAIEIEKEGIFLENEKEILEEEAREVSRLLRSGELIEIYFTAKGTAVMELETESILRAHEILNSLPLVSSGLSTFDIIELKPYTGFDRLIKADADMYEEI